MDRTTASTVRTRTGWCELAGRRGRGARRTPLPLSGGWVCSFYKGWPHGGQRVSLSRSHFHPRFRLQRRSAQRADTVLV